MQQPDITAGKKWVNANLLSRLLCFHWSGFSARRSILRGSEAAIASCRACCESVVDDDADRYRHSVRASVPPGTAYGERLPRCCWCIIVVRRGGKQEKRRVELKWKRGCGRRRSIAWRRAGRSRSDRRPGLNGLQRTAQPLRRWKHRERESNYGTSGTNTTDTEVKECSPIFQPDQPQETTVWVCRQGQWAA